jgi:hypothetical protein
MRYASIMPEDSQEGCTAIKPEINTCKISHIFTSINKGKYDVAIDALSSQTVMNGIKQYAIQYNMMLLLKIPQISVMSPENIFKSRTVMLKAIDDYDDKKSSTAMVVRLSLRAIAGSKIPSVCPWNQPFNQKLNPISNAYLQTNKVRSLCYASSLKRW